jgi:hypothetical protein
VLSRQQYIRRIEIAESVSFRQGAYWAAEFLSEGGIFTNEGLDFLKQVGIRLEALIIPSSTCVLLPTMSGLERKANASGRRHWSRDFVSIVSKKVG